MFTHHKPFLFRIVYMKMNQNIAQKITTSTSITTVVQQALKVLHMTNLELSDYAQQEALENPFLIVNSTDFANQLPSAPVAETPWSDTWETGESGSSDDSEGSLWEKTLSQPQDINQLIVSQINSSFSNTTEHRLALVLFSLLDERGFFTLDINIIAHHLKIPVSLIQSVLTRLKTLEPAGLFAADWKESVLLQLVDQGHPTEIYSVILDNFQDILQGKLSNLQKASGLSSEAIYRALKRIKNINPYPLKHNEADDVVQLKVPDVIVTKDANNGWVVSLNQDTLPKALADREYFQEIKTSCSLEEEKTFIRDSFQRATWLVKAMDQRCQNILKICESLIKKQQSFLDHGPKLLTPMTLKDIAAEVGVHESTVSRAIAHKYIQTPQGIYPLKYFFTQSIQGSFQDYSAESIRSQIRNLIQNETLSLSDDKIAEILNNLGVDIARRTVTKYRESMSIPSSTERRRIKKITSM
jgi:RNA polymerase sigma-54 factor